MRWVFGLVGLLIALLVVLHLSSRQSRRAFDAVSAITPALREEVAPRTFDEAAAGELVDHLDSLVDEPAPASEELREAAATCAAWAAGARPGSREHHIAVKLRSAANALLSAPGEASRRTVRRLLAEARSALARPAGPGQDPVEGLRDQLQNLENARRERQQEVEHDLP
ncbi:MAG: hypothetical protein V1750_10260 [Acidobacteriota bacterium]